MPDRPPHYEQSGVIACRCRDGTLEIALITSASGKRWVIPKGLVDPGETPLDSAVRETQEEAGLLGTADPEPIGHYTYDKWGGTCHVEVFRLDVEVEMDTWLEAGVRERRWVTIEEAAELVREPELAAIIRGLG